MINNDVSKVVNNGNKIIFHYHIEYIFGYKGIGLKYYARSLDMNKILLINRLDPQDYSDEKQKIFFMIGGMNIPDTENRLIDVIRQSNIVESDDMILKYNGIELNISIQQIPAVVKLLSRENFAIYEIYQPYNPEG